MRPELECIADTLAEERRLGCNHSIDLGTPHCQQQVDTEPEELTENAQAEARMACRDDIRSG